MNSASPFVNNVKWRDITFLDGVFVMFIFGIIVLFVMEAITIILLRLLITSGRLNERWWGLGMLPFILALIFQVFMLIKFPNKVIDFYYNKNPFYFGRPIKDTGGIWIASIVLLIFFIYMFLVNIGLIN